MARLWSTGFELQSATSGIEWDTSTGTISIDTTTKRSGNAALRCNPSAATGFITHAFQADAIITCFHRFYIYIASYPASGTPAIWQYADSANGVGYSLHMTTAGVIQMVNDSNASTVLASSSALSLNTWYRIEVKVVDDANLIAQMELQIDGSTVASLTGLTGMNGGGRIRLGAITSATCDLYFDDVAVNDTSGSAQTGYPGSGKIVHLLPNAVGDNSGGTRTGGSDYPSALAATPPDDTSFISLTATSQIGDVNVTDPATAGINSVDTVTLVAVGNRAAATTAAACSIALRIKSASGGTTTSSGNIVRNTTAFSTHDDTANLHQYKLTSYTDPTTGVAWTPTGTNSLQNMQIGFSSADVTPNPKVGDIWALVEYVPGVVRSMVTYSKNKRSSMAALITR